MSWPRKPLLQIAPPIPSEIRFSPDETVWHLSLDQIESKTGQITNQRIAAASEAGTSTYTFDEGNVLYSKLRPYLNKVVRPSSPGIATTELVPLRPIPGVLDPDFLVYYLRSPEFVAFAQSCVAGAKMPRVIMNKFWAQQVPLPALSEQRRIVDILDKAERIRRLRVEADAMSERLVPAMFMTAFGEPVANPRSWPRVPISDFFTDERHGPRCGPFGSALKKHEYVEEGIPVWGIDNVMPDRFVEAGSLFITEDKYNELTSYSVLSGDLLISRAGTVGRLCVARPSIAKSIIGTNLIRLAFNASMLEPEYLSALLTYFPQCTSRLRATSDEGAYSFMNTAVLRSIAIPYPPTELQRAFVNKLKRVRESGRRAAECHTRIETMFRHLLQRAFAGTLTTKWREAQKDALLVEMEAQAQRLSRCADQFVPA